MLAELLLIGKLLTPTVGQSTPKAVSPSKLFGRNDTKRISKPPTKKGPALGLKKYF